MSIAIASDPDDVMRITGLSMAARAQPVLDLAEKRVIALQSIRIERPEYAVVAKSGDGLESIRGAQFGNAPAIQ